jgi:hypothetical protein
MKAKTRRCHGIVPAVLLLAANLAAAADFYVAPEGKDSSLGTQEQPFASVARAQQAVRELRSREPDRPRPIVVSIGGGWYELAEPIVFRPEDSGTARAPVTYEAAAGQRPILSGGRKITGWKVGPDGRWRVTLDEVKSGQWNFRQLFVDDQRRFPPRLPKKGYFTIAGEIKPPTSAEGYTQFVYGEGDVKADWANRDDLIVHAFHIWCDCQMRIAAVEPEKRILTFTGSTRGKQYYTAHAKGNRYRVLNVKEALSEPGEWYLDRPTGELTYIPRPGETPEKCTVVAPRIESLVLFQGDVAGHKWVEHVRLTGLTLAHSNWLLGPKGMSVPQAAIGVPEAITAFGARNLVIDGCCVRHTGGYAIGFGAGCKENVVRNCELVDLGAGGVKVGYAGSSPWRGSHEVSKDPEGLPSHHTIENCTIAHAGRLHPPAVGVWIGKSPYNKVLHNEIYDLYYTAVSVGWVWGYGPSPAHHNEIAYNHLHTIGQGVLSDMGGVYSLGIQPGTTVHHNHVHDVHSFGYGGWGLYTDEGSTGIVLSDNLVYRTKDGGFDQHYGRGNLVTNNIFAFGLECLIRRNDRRDRHTSFTFQRNIVLLDRGFILGGGWGTSADSYYTLDHNLYWHADGKPVLFAKGMDFKAWQAKHGQDQHSLVADPKFVDARRGDFRLAPDSPAIAKLGFKPFDYTRAGRTSPPLLTKGLPPVPRAFD